MKSKRNVLTLVVVFGLWLGLILGCQGTTDESIKISAEDLYKAYHDDESGADLRYKYKTLIVTGKVGKTDNKNREVYLADAQGSVIVWCLRFAADQADAISKLKVGDTVSVKGKCDGRASIMGMSVDQVSLRDCVLQ